jgi:transglutaminase-like putative cysteine protease
VLLRLGYTIDFEVPAPVAIVTMLHVHPTRSHDLLEPDTLKLNPYLPLEMYLDQHGNTCTRFVAPAGTVSLTGSTLIHDSGDPDPINVDARQHPIEELPYNVLPFLLGSRYCEVDLLLNPATELFAHTAPGWPRVKAICDWVHQKVVFGYRFARPTKTALDVYTERAGVCRDFQHLAVTFCRCMNIPARYVTGYLGDIGVSPSASPMDFSAWFEVYLENRWWTFDARHNVPRIGRVLMAVGRDATDVAITTSFGQTNLKNFQVVTEEVRSS